MGIWDSVRTAVDRVTGSAANVTLTMDPTFVMPEQTVSVRIGIKNGPSPLDVRAVLLEVESIEQINLPRHADVSNVILDAARQKQGDATSAPPVTRHDEKTFEVRVTVGPGRTLSAGEERNYQGTFRLPSNVQPSYEGKYVKHVWRLRARLDVLGVDPSTGWLGFRVGTSR